MKKSAAPTSEDRDATGASARPPTSQWLVSTLLCTLPGVVGGIQLSGLLLFLNPHLPTELMPWLRASALYALLLGAASALTLMPWVRGRRRRAARVLPWALSAVFAIAAVVDWTQASLLAFYLPPGINRRLIKAAVLLSVAAVIAFYTALLHTLHRRTYGTRSRVGLTLLALSTIYVIVERREAFRPPPASTPRPSAMEPDQRPTLLVVGLEGASLDAILPLAEQGHLPFFSESMARGVWGRVRSIRPVRREPLWTTLATGKHPYQHGVVGNRAWNASYIAPGAELRLAPIGLGSGFWGAQRARPRSMQEARRAQPLWGMMDRLNVETVVVDWPGLDDLDRSGLAGFHSVVGARRVEAEAFPMFTTAPSDAMRTAVHADATRLARVRELLSSARADTGLAPAGAVVTVLPGLRLASEEWFGGYAAAQLDGSRSEEHLAAAQDLSAYYSFLDSHLATLWNELPEPRLLAVVSAYGTTAPGGLGRAWRRLLRVSDLKGSTSGTPDGVLLLRGNGIAADVRLSEVTLPDITPALLYAMGMPLARDFDGTLPTEAFTGDFLARTPLTLVPSYETLTPGFPPDLRPPPATESASEAAGASTGR